LDDEELIDIEDEEVPLVSGVEAGGENKEWVAPAAVVATATVTTGAAGAAAYTIIGKKAAVKAATKAASGAAKNTAVKAPTFFKRIFRKKK